jgi:hypothetical protein
MDLLRTFMAILAAVQKVIAYAQTLVSDKAKLAQQLADTQQELATALADDKADAEAIDSANAKAIELQKLADAETAKVAELQATVASMGKDEADAIAAIEAFVPKEEAPAVNA